MRGPVMGTVAHVIVPGEPALVQAAFDRLCHLESLWSRFVPTSDVARLNRSHGATVTVAPETADVIAHAVDAWRWSGGCFDPTVERCLVAAGYDRTFEEVSTRGRAEAATSLGLAIGPSPGCTGIVVAGSSVTVPAGITLDLGGIGKGRAADVVLADALARGASGACINVGGDVAVAGAPPSADGWVIGVDDPFLPGHEVMQLVLDQGAVATTSRMRRRWSWNGAEQHHLIDPRTGAPVATDTAAVTVVAGTASLAEVLAKVLFIDRRLGRVLLDEHGASAIVIDTNRRVELVGDVVSIAA